MFLAAGHLRRVQCGHCAKYVIGRHGLLWVEMVVGVHDRLARGVVAYGQIVIALVDQTVQLDIDRFVFG